MVHSTLSLAQVVPVSGKPVEARFDGSRLSSDRGLLLFREVEKRLGVAERLAAWPSGWRLFRAIRVTPGGSTMGWRR